MTDNIDKTLNGFAVDVLNAKTFGEALDVVYTIILAGAYDNDLVAEALDRVNTKLDWSASIDKVQSNMSELN